MDKLKDRPKVTVTRSGVHRVTPSEIFNSRVGREQILRTAKVMTPASPRLRDAKTISKP